MRMLLEPHDTEVLQEHGLELNFQIQHHCRFCSSSTALPLLHLLYCTSSSPLPLPQFLYCASSTTLPLPYFHFRTSSSTFPLPHLLYHTPSSQLPHFLSLALTASQGFVLRLKLTDLLLEQASLSLPPSFSLLHVLHFLLHPLLLFLHQ